VRYCVCAKVEGDIFLTAPGSIKRGDYIFEFRLTPDSRLSEIAVSIVVPEEKLSSMATSFEQGEGEIKLKINIGGDRELFDRLISELQLLESDLSFATLGTLRKICWDNPSSIEFIPETERDTEIPTLASFAFHKAYPPARAILSIETIKGMIGETSQSSQLRFAKAFWREGLEYHDQFKYIQAFYSFFFVIEDFFARGKTGESEVIKQFSRSPEFQDLLQKGFTSILEEKRHKQKLLRLFEDEELEPNLDSLPKFLFRVRGKLHHYYSESSKFQGTPFNQADFESLSLLVMYIATETIRRHDPGEWVKSMRIVSTRSA
jgi:hypothetical protein